MSRIREICGNADHFWFPEVRKHIESISKNPHAVVKLDLKTLYHLRSESLLDRIVVLVLKIFHRLKMCLSKNYRNTFESSIQILTNHEQKTNEIAIVQNPEKENSIKEHIKRAEDVRKEKIKVETEQKNNAAQVIQNVWKMHRIRKKFKPLRLKISENEKRLNNEIAVIAILTQFNDCKVKIKDLEEKKPKGLLKIFKGESAEDQEVRKNTLKRLDRLVNDIHANNLISKKFKEKLEKEDIQSVVNEEMTLHEKMLQDCQQIIQKAKLDVHHLVPTK